jgi:hypothetical protein
MELLYKYPDFSLPITITCFVGLSAYLVAISCANAAFGLIRRVPTCSLLSAPCVGNSNSTLTFIANPIPRQECCTPITQVRSGLVAAKPNNKAVPTGIAIADPKLRSPPLIPHRRRLKSVRRSARKLRRRRR